MHQGFFPHSLVCMHFPEHFLNTYDEFLVSINNEDDDDDI